MSLSPAAPVVNATPAAINAQEQRQLGWDRFRAGEPVSACTSTFQRNGWHNALNAAADAETYQYLAAVRS